MNIQLRSEPAAGPRCVQCGQPVGNARLAFGGGLACEPCVRRYYADRPEEELGVILAERTTLAAKLGAGGARKNNVAG